MTIDQVFFRTSPQPMWLYDVETLRFLEVNPAAVRAYGYSRDEFLAMTIQEIRPPEDRPEVAREKDRPGVHDRARTWRHLRKDGSVRHVDVISQPMEFRGRDARLITALDVTERVRTQERLRESEELHRLLFDAAPVGVLSLDPTGRILRANRALHEMLGYDPGELRGLSIWELTHPDDRSQSVGAMRDLEERRIERVAFEKRYLRKDGTCLWVRVTAGGVWDANGALDRTIGIIEDVSERREAQTLVEEQRRFFEQILGSLDLDIASFDPEGRFEYVNPQSVKDPDVRSWMIGRTNVEYAQNRKDDPEMGRARHESILEAARSGEPNELEEVVRTTGGEPRFFLRHHTPVTDEDGKVVRVVGFGVDRTEWHRAQEAPRRSEERLHEAQKMEAVGRLAGGVAHDFNNLLTVILGHSELLLHGTGSLEDVRSDVLEVRKAAERAAALVRQLLALGRRQPARLEPVALNTVLRDQEMMLRRLLGERIDLHLDLESRDGGPLVRVDSGQLEQVVLNLVLNARDAMGDGGELRIGIRDVDEGGRFLALEVADTGQGMSPEVRDRIFEPFFSTKPREEGTGLGLSVVYGLVKLWDGAVEVETEPGEGTTFRILLPRVDG